MILWALVLVPVVLGLAVSGLASRPRLMGGVAIAAALATLGLGVAAAAGAPATALPWTDRLGLKLSLNGFARPMAILVPLIASAVFAYAVGEERGPARPRLLALLCVFLGSMELLVAAADLLTLLIGFELVGACSWALIGYPWRDPESGPAANHAFLATRVGDLGLFVAAGAALAGVGSLGFDALPGLSRPGLDVVAAGVLLAAIAKSAQLPFSTWLISAMRGPTPVSALLHSATMVAAGAYVLIRLAPALEPTGWFSGAVAGVGLVTAVAGGVVASSHDHIKKALAASTSAQYGLIFLAVGAGSTLAAGLHLVVHAAFKALLFLGAGVAIHAAGSPRLDRMGLGSSLPRVAALFGLGALALAAVPPLGGAFSKEAVLSAAADRSSWLGFGAVAAGLLSAFYAARLHLLAFGPGGAGKERRPGPLAMGSLSLLALLSLLLGGLWLPGGDRWLERVAGVPLPHAAGWVPVASLSAVAAGLGLATVLYRRGSLTALGLSPAIRRAANGWFGLHQVSTRGVAVPVLALAGRLAAFDDRVVDAGVRAAVRFGALLSRMFASLVERGVDGVVKAISDTTLSLARGSGKADDLGVDAAVEGVARGVGAGGRASRGLQSGLLHQYYLIMAVGFAVAVIVLFGAK